MLVGVRQDSKLLPSRDSKVEEQVHCKEAQILTYRKPPTQGTTSS